MNTIEKLLSGNTLEIRTNGKVICNALTTQVASSLMSHCSRRGQNSDPLAGLDVRNEQDEATRGQELRNLLTDEAGHEVPEEPMHIAQICDGLRFTVYDELAKALGPETPVADDILYRTNPQFAKSYDLPMSLESMLDFRLSRAGVVDEAKVKFFAADQGEDESFVRAAMKEQAERDVKRLRTLIPDVMAEAGSLDEAYDLDAFDSLSKELQQRIIGKVYAALGRENKRLMGLMIRGVETVKVDKDPVPVATLRKFVKNSLATCEEFLEAAALGE